MNNYAEELDRAIAAASTGSFGVDPEMNELAQIALDLKTIADPEFREQLKADVLDHAARQRFAPGTITR